jgi:hypothetical protein
MKYTKFKEADELVERYLDIIIKEIKQNCPGLKAIILAGGYGRGEGAVEMVKGKPRLLNDLDMYLITKKQLSDSLLEKIGQKCSKMIGKGGKEYPENYDASFDFDTFFNVDLRGLPVKRLKHLIPTVRYYEMKNGTRLLYGEDVRKLIPEIKPENLPFSEGLRVLSNRMMNMFLSMNEEYLEKKPSKDQIGIINYYICKAYLSCSDALLLSVGKFAPSYSERAEIFIKEYSNLFPGLHKRFPELRKKVESAISYKLNPDIKKINYKKEWFEARKIITEVFRYILLKEMGKKEILWEDLNKLMGREFEKKYYKDYAEFLLNQKNINLPILREILIKTITFSMSFLYFLKLKEDTGKFYPKAVSFRDAGIKIMNLTPLVLLSLKEDGTLENRYIPTIKKILAEVYPLGEINSWKSLKKNYLDAYKLYYLRRFV